jgi:uncharacterized protein YktA (UPF0223 family)
MAVVYSFSSFWHSMGFMADKLPVIIVGFEQTEVRYEKRVKKFELMEARQQYQCVERARIEVSR